MKANRWDGRGQVGGGLSQAGSNLSRPQSDPVQAGPTSQPSTCILHLRKLRRPHLNE